jgi:hypothetical protein
MVPPGTPTGRDQSERAINGSVGRAPEAPQRHTSRIASSGSGTDTRSSCPLSREEVSVELIRYWSLESQYSGASSISAASPVDREELEELSKNPGLETIDAANLSPEGAALQYDPEEVCRALELISGCPVHGPLVRSGLWDRRVGRILVERGTVACHRRRGTCFRSWRIEKPLRDVEREVKRRAYLAWTSLCASDPTSMLGADRAQRVSLCILYAFVTNGPDSSVGARVPESGLVLGRCSQTSVCPVCAAFQALHHLRNFLLAARHEKRIAPACGRLEWVEIADKEARSLQAALGSVSVRIKRWGTPRSIVVAYAHPGTLGAEVMRDRDLWDLFEPPALTAFLPDGSGFADPGYLARVDGAARQRGVWLRVPKIPRSSEEFTTILEDIDSPEGSSQQKQSRNRRRERVIRRLEGYTGLSGEERLRQWYAGLAGRSPVWRRHRRPGSPFVAGALVRFSEFERRGRIEGDVLVSYGDPLDPREGFRQLRHRGPQAVIEPQLTLPGAREVEGSIGNSGRPQ